MATRPPRVLAISDGRLGKSGPAGLGRLRGWIEALLGCGVVDGVQLREKRAADRTVYELAVEARSLAARSEEASLEEASSEEGGKLRLLINGRPDIALAARSDGVHLPVSGLPPERARSLLGAGALIGCSTHHVEEVAAAFDGGADYVTFGPVYSTPSKARYGPPPGLAGLERAAECGGPVLALGGITVDRARECLEAGAYGIAGIRLFERPGALQRLKDLFGDFEA